MRTPLYKDKSTEVTAEMQLQRQGSNYLNYDLDQINVRLLSNCYLMVGKCKYWCPS